EERETWAGKIGDMMASYKLEASPELYRAWAGPNFPRFIAVTFQHPTPFFDDSYAVNSANNGPYGDAIIRELIPYLESHFRMIAKPYARLLTGGSTGGWESLASQVFYPDFYGGGGRVWRGPRTFRRLAVGTAGGGRDARFL